MFDMPAEDQPLGGSDGDISELADANGATQQTAANGVTTPPPNPPIVTPQSATTDQLMFLMGRLWHNKARSKKR